MEHPQYTDIQPDIFFKEAQAANLSPAQFAALIGVPLPNSCNHSTVPPHKTTLPNAIANKQGLCTQTDYETLPAALRAQLIDGFIVTSHPITIMHQRIISELLYQITTYIKDTLSPYKCITSPVRLYLPSDPSTVLLPDLALLYHPAPVSLHQVTGLPDFIAEVTAPSSTYLDSIKKLQKYRDAGVREYWIINWVCQEIQAFQFHTNKDTEVKKYHMDTRIPVHTHCGLYLDLRDLEG